MSSFELPDEMQEGESALRQTLVEALDREPGSDSHSFLSDAERQAIAEVVGREVTQLLGPRAAAASAIADRAIALAMQIVDRIADVPEGPPASPQGGDDDSS